MESKISRSMVLLLAAACGDNGAGEDSGTTQTTVPTASVPFTSSDSDSEPQVPTTGGGTVTDTATATVPTTSTTDDPGTLTENVSTSGETLTTSEISATSSGTSTSGTSGTSSTGDSSSGDTSSDETTEEEPPPCFECTPDLHGVQTCDGQLVEQCNATDGCDVESVSCINACTAAEISKQSVGCRYYATFMQHWDGPGNRCFAAFVANTWNTPAHLNVTRAGQALNIAAFTRLPSGQGQGLMYAPYDAGQGLAPGDVAILFLAGPQGAAPSCPVASAVPSGVAVAGTGKGDSFRIESDVPVVAYQINPYGGGMAAVTGASLLLPTSAWDVNYVVINSLPASVGVPSANIIAHENNTTVTIEPLVAMAGGGGIPAGAAGTPTQFVLQAGQHAQLSQTAELTGSVILADKPVGLMGGHTGMQAPVGTAYSDHAEQMIPPVRALGSEYVGVMHRPRAAEPAIWRVVGAVNGTQLTYSTNVGGPAAVNRGDKVEFVSGTPFVVKSQDKDHPFFLFTYMSGSQWAPYQPTLNNRGDSDYVISVPTDQYMSRYVFFTDPTYPETNLVLVRKKNADVFADVNLDCSGVVTGWQAVGDYEWARVDLSTGNFQGVNGCSNGRHEITSAGRFGMWIWGWGTTMSNPSTQNVSYGYPGGMNVQLINDVIIMPQ